MNDTPAAAPSVAAAPAAAPPAVVAAARPLRASPGYQALVAACGVWAAVMVALALHLADPWWAGISAWVIAQAGNDRHALLAKAGMRFLGTICGCLAGYWLGALLVGPGLFPVALALSLVAWIGAWQRFSSAYAYAWLVFSLTATMAVLAAVTEPASLAPFVLNRWFEITSGIVTYSVVAIILNPAAQHGGPLHAPAAAPAGPAAGSAASAQWMAVEHTALIAALIPPLLLVLWLALDLPSIMQVFISTLVLVDRDIGQMRTRSRQRLIGCLVGGAGGILLAIVLPDSLFLWSLSLFTGLFLLAFVHQGNPKTAYYGTQGGLAFLMGLVTGAGPPASILPVVERVVGITIGVAVLVLVAALIRPHMARRLRAAAPA